MLLLLVICLARFSVSSSGILGQIRLRQGHFHVIILLFIDGVYLRMLSCRRTQDIVEAKLVSHVHLVFHILRRIVFSILSFTSRLLHRFSVDL